MAQVLAPLDLKKPADRLQNVGRLLISCLDRPGLVAAITNYLASIGANIIHSDQHSVDPFGGQFFMRVEFYLTDLAEREQDFRAGFSMIASDFHGEWRLSLAAVPKRVVLFASRADHALLELLWRFHSGDLFADVQMVVSNHAVLEPLATRYNIPFYHVPKTAANRAEAELEELRLIGDKADLIVLARYMQIISPAFLNLYRNRIINIHHSFLPAFVGADPYKGAFDRGVKLIGATAHYVTEELDAGPIIEQDVLRVTHAQNVDDLRRIGRFVERAVLAKAVESHLEDRVIVHENKSIVFV